MANRPSPPRTSWALLVVLVAALATGAAASILVSASTAPPPASGSASLVILPQSVVAAVAVGVLLFVVGLVIYQRITSTHTVSLNRVAVLGLVAILLGILFIVVVRLVGFGGPLPTLSPGGSGGSGNSSGSTGNGGGGNVTGPGGHIVLFPNLPSWLPFALLAALALIVVLVVVPEVRQYLAERGPRSGPKKASAPAMPAGVREALTRASAELDLGEDPRLVILALYTDLLHRVESIVGDVGTSTPEEIRADHLVRLGVRPAAAESLTRLFEEARYSTHPMGPEASERAQAAVRLTLADLDRRDFPS